MLTFEKPTLQNRPEWEKYLRYSQWKGCEYNFVNLYLWGRQKAAVLEDFLVFFSQFDRKSVYLYPSGQGDIQKPIEAILDHAQRRDITCRITGLLEQDCQTLEEAFPGKFQFHCDRAGFDYVYRTEDLATLKGRKFQKKRNHLNRFRQEYPHHRFEPITQENSAQVMDFCNNWFEARLKADPHQDFHLEQAALKKALGHFEELGLFGLALYDGDALLAVTLGSIMSEDTMDVHFEKAMLPQDGVYAAINQGFAAYVQQTLPHITFLNREDDMGLPGLRQAKLSYTPDHMVEKYWAKALEDSNED